LRRRCATTDVSLVHGLDLLHVGNKHGHGGSVKNGAYSESRELCHGLI
jgi:hypothetical protein